MEEPRQTVSGAYDRISAHEDLCAERYRGIHEGLDDVRNWLRWILTGVVGVLISVLGWALFQVYSLEPLRQTQTIATVSTTVTHHP